MMRLFFHLFCDGEVRVEATRAFEHLRAIDELSNANLVASDEIPR